MKKTVSIILSAVIVLGLFSCCGCTKKREQILIYSTGEEERIAFVQEKLNEKFPNYDIIIQEIGTGALVSKLQGEGVDTDCDIIHELEITNMEILLDSNPEFFYDLKDYDFSKFSDTVLPYSHKKYAPQCMTYCSVVYNTKVLADNGLDVPKTYEDLLKPEYKNLISIPNPKSSGTGYAFYNGLISTLGEEKATEYFDKLNGNIKEYSTSGSTPIKSVDRGEIAVGFAMLWQCVEYCANNKDLGYTSLDMGSPYNLYDMAVINGHEKRECVVEVFDYIFNELNQIDIEKFIPDSTYKNYSPENADYPKDITPIKMNGVCDPSYKENLLDMWKY